ncbi:hypothetical protein N9R62_03610 [Porticoccaceae bacterium]|nr:hypothetical protein [Porticoccaceae bacterium]
MLVTGLQYLSYSTGLYGRQNAGGLTLQLLCERTGEDYYVIFNADIKRKRNFKDKKAGTLLPKGRFSVGRKSAFYKFWLSTGISIPPRLSAFNDYMGKLKGLLFIAEIESNNRLNACSLRLMTNNPQTDDKQSPNKLQTNTSNSNVSQNLIATTDSKNITTYMNNYDISKQVSTNTSNTYAPINDVIDVKKQTYEEWINDYFGNNRLDKLH